MNELNVDKAFMFNVHKSKATQNDLQNQGAHVLKGVITVQLK